jgi:hypothetical protein
MSPRITLPYRDVQFSARKSAKNYFDEKSLTCWFGDKIHLSCKSEKKFIKKLPGSNGFKIGR